MSISKDKFHFNPFSGVLDKDIKLLISPVFDLEEFCKKLLNSPIKTFEFVGKQGRGKTTNLKYLHEYLGKYPIFYLDKNSKYEPIINHSSPIVFIDSIHHINIFDRHQLFKSNKTIIYTTHWSKKLECIIAKRTIHSISFKGIDVTHLQNILNKRLENACIYVLEKNDNFSKEDCQLLIQNFGDNYRGIINHLYNIYK